MKPHDKAALTLALEMCRAESAVQARQIDSMLKTQPWLEVADFAATVCQTKSLALQVWDSPPCDMSQDDDGEVDAAAVKLLRMMLAAGVSRWHPDPMAALAEAKQKGAA